MESENKTIARNSLLLYMRTFLIMIITLYTVRVTLKILGFVDYGIYNTVGGVIAIFAFLSNTLTSVSQRYFSFFLGKNDVLRLRQLFNSLLIIYTTIAVGIAVIAELSGSWLINNYLTIPADRIGATMWIYHFSILTLVINFIQIPYNSVIISRERMSIYAYLSILEVLLKLLVVFLLFYITFNSVFDSAACCCCY
jgi:O-antigen/teichoic acid export membrane protein